MRITPEDLKDESLTTAATRLDFLSRRDTGETTLNRVVEEAADDEWSSFRLAETSLDIDEALELLALGEVVARKAHGSRLVGIRAALRGGADWEEIAEALGCTPQAAWDSFAESLTRSVEDDELRPEAADSARELAGTRPTR